MTNAKGPLRKIAPEKKMATRLRELNYMFALYARARTSQGRIQTRGGGGGGGHSDPEISR